MSGTGDGGLINSLMSASSFPNPSPHLGELVYPRPTFSAQHQRFGSDPEPWNPRRPGTTARGYGFSRATRRAQARHLPGVPLPRSPPTASAESLNGGARPPGRRVVIERRRGGRWRRVTSLRARGDRLFFAKRRIRRGTLMRAQAIGPSWHSAHGDYPNFGSRKASALRIRARAAFRRACSASSRPGRRGA